MPLDRRRKKVMRSDEKKARKKKIHMNTDVERAPGFKEHTIREEYSKGDVLNNPKAYNTSVKS